METEQSTRTEYFKDYYLKSKETTYHCECCNVILKRYSWCKHRQTKTHLLNQLIRKGGIPEKAPFPKPIKLI